MPQKYVTDLIIGRTLLTEYVVISDEYFITVDVLQTFSNID